MIASKWEFRRQEHTSLLREVLIMALLSKKLDKQTKCVVKIIQWSSLGACGGGGGGGTNVES